VVNDTGSQQVYRGGRPVSTLSWVGMIAAPLTDFDARLRTWSSNASADSISLYHDAAKEYDEHDAFPEESSCSPILTSCPS
jgi:hypothetical protein